MIKKSTTHECKEGYWYEKSRPIFISVAGTKTYNWPFDKKNQVKREIDRLEEIEDGSQH